MSNFLQVFEYVLEHSAFSFFNEQNGFKNTKVIWDEDAFKGVVKACHKTNKDSYCTYQFH